LSGGWNINTASLKQVPLNEEEIVITSLQEAKARKTVLFYKHGISLSGSNDPLPGATVSAGRGRSKGSWSAVVLEREKTEA